MKGGYRGRIITHSDVEMSLLKIIIGKLFFYRKNLYRKLYNFDYFLNENRYRKKIIWRCYFELYIYMDVLL